MSTEPVMRGHDLAQAIAWGQADQFAPIADWLTGDWAAELKLNGCRVLYTLLKGRARLMTPRGGIRSEAAPLLAAVDMPALAGTTLDCEFMAPPAPGEVYAPFPRTNGWLNSSAREAAKKARWWGPPELWVFDVLRSRSQDMTRKPYTDRRAEAERIVRKIAKRYPGCGIRLVPQLPATAATIQAVLDVGHEGVMLKRVSPPDQTLYRPGTRSRAWAKVKATVTVDAFLTGNTRPGEGARAGTTGSVEVAVLGDDGQILTLGYVGVPPQLAAAYTDRDAGGLPLAKVGEVWECETNGRTQTGSLRHPRFARVRDDKTPELCSATVLAALPVAA